MKKKPIIEKRIKEFNDGYDVGYHDAMVKFIEIINEVMEKKNENKQ